MNLVNVPSLFDVVAELQVRWTAFIGRPVHRKDSFGSVGD